MGELSRSGIVGVIVVLVCLIISPFVMEKERAPAENSIPLDAPTPSRNVSRKPSGQQQPIEKKGTDSSTGSNAVSTVPPQEQRRATGEDLVWLISVGTITREFPEFPVEFGYRLSSREVAKLTAFVEHFPGPSQNCRSDRHITGKDKSVTVRQGQGTVRVVLQATSRNLQGPHDLTIGANLWPADGGVPRFAGPFLFSDQVCVRMGN